MTTEKKNDVIKIALSVMIALLLAIISFGANRLDKKLDKIDDNQKEFVDKLEQINQKIADSIKIGHINDTRITDHNKEAEIWKQRIGDNTKKIDDIKDWADRNFQRK